jgi:hypothetical protein
MRVRGGEAVCGGLGNLVSRIRSRGRGLFESPDSPTVTFLRDVELLHDEPQCEGRATKESQRGGRGRSLYEVGRLVHRSTAELEPQLGRLMRNLKQQLVPVEDPCVGSLLQLHELVVEQLALVIRW